METIEHIERAQRVGTVQDGQIVGAGAGKGVGLDTSNGGKGGIDDGQGGGGLEEEEEVPGSVRLLAEWVRRASDDGNFRGRFKAIGDVINAEEVLIVLFLVSPCSGL